MVFITNSIFLKTTDVISALYCLVSKYCLDGYRVLGTGPVWGCTWDGASRNRLSFYVGTAIMEQMALGSMH